MPTDKIPAHKIITLWHRAMRSNPDLIRDVREAHANYGALLVEMGD